MRKQVVSYGCLALVLALALSLAPATFAQGKVAETIQVNAHVRPNPLEASWQPLLKNGWKKLHS